MSKKGVVQGVKIKLIVSKKSVVQGVKIRFTVSKKVLFKVSKSGS